MATLVLRIGEPKAPTGRHPITLHEAMGSDSAGELPPILTDELDTDLVKAAKDAAKQPNIGALLGKVLFGTTVGKEWLARVRADALLHTLIDIAPVALRRLPWESTLYGALPIFNQVPCAIARFSAYSASIRAKSPIPLRVLFVVGCADDDRVSWQDELRSVRKTLVRLGPGADDDVLIRPTANQLADKMASFEPDVLHFIGHGGTDAQTGTIALLIWDEATESDHPWSASDIANTFFRFTPRIVFLNACHAGDIGASGDEEDLAFDLAEAFLEAGAQAVIGMQGPIFGETAALVADSAYRAIAKGEPLDTALSLARGRAHGESNKPDVKRDFWRPRLFLTELPERLGLSALGKQIPATLLVDRKPQRRVIDKHIQRPAAVLLYGERQVGKTALLHHCLATSALRGHTARYVNLDGGAKIGTLSILNAIIVRQDQRAPEDQRAALPREPFRKYIWTADHLRRGREPPPLTETTAVPELVTGDLESFEPRHIEVIFRCFREALIEIAKQHPLVLGLDHLKDADATDFGRHIVPHLISPIAKGTVPGVALVISALETELDTLGLRNLVTEVPVLAFPAVEWGSLAEDFLWACNLKDEVGLTDIVSGIGKRILKEGPWKPTRLSRLRALLDGMGGA